MVTAEVLELPPAAEELDALVAGVGEHPAVYLIWAREGRPYLGRTSLLGRRLRRLLRPPAGPSRLLNLRGVACRIEYWRTASRLEAALVEYSVARRHFPEDYCSLIRLRTPPYVKVILSNPFPRCQITTRLAGSRSLYFGPFRSRASADQFAGQALDLFQVRRCDEDLAPSLDHPGCIYGEMNMCLRPCQQVVGPAEYASEVERLVTFFSTGGQSLLEATAAARQRLSEEMDFEEAARQHRRYERIESLLQSRDELAGVADRLHGVAVTPSVAADSVELWFMAQGGWLEARRFALSDPRGKSVSMDRRLREMVDSLEPPGLALWERQEHLALLARWYYSSWRDGEWLGCEDFQHLPYRKLVNAIHRVATNLGPPAQITGEARPSGS